MQKQIIKHNTNNIQKQIVQQYYANNQVYNK